MKINEQNLLILLTCVLLLLEQETKQTITTPPLSRSASDFTFSDLYEASRKNDTYDQGLTAESILSRRFLQKELCAEAEMNILLSRYKTA